MTTAKGTGCIYMLTNPHNGRCRFVGSTIDPGNCVHRFFFTNSNQWNFGLYVWRAKLADQNLLPGFVIVESGVPIQHLRRRQAEWIRRKASEGCMLLNRETDGIKKADMVPSE